MESNPGRWVMMVRITGYTLEDGKLVKASKNKFGARKTELNGRTFDSSYEAEIYCQRKLQEQAGEITNLELQRTFTLQEAFRDRAGKKHRAITWTADFTYIENGVKVAEDVKGYSNIEANRIRHKLFARHYPDWILKVTKKDKR